MVEVELEAEAEGEGEADHVGLPDLLYLALEDARLLVLLPVLGRP